MQKTWTWSVTSGPLLNKSHVEKQQECVGNRGHRFRLPFGIQLPCGLGLDRVGRVLCQYNR